MKSESGYDSGEAFSSRRPSMFSRRKTAPAPLDFTSTSNVANDSSEDGPLPTSFYRLDTATIESFALPTPARALFEGSGINHNDPLGSLMTPLRPDHQGGIDVNINFSPNPASERQAAEAASGPSPWLHYPPASGGGQRDHQD